MTREDVKSRILKLEADREALEAIIVQIDSLNLTWKKGILHEVELAIDSLRERIEDCTESLKTIV